MFPAIPQRTAERLLRRAGAEHRARDHVRRRERVAEPRRDVDHRPGGHLRREARGGLHLVEPLSERAHDPPAADVRAGGDREAGGDLHPGRDVEVVDRAVGEERERDHAHRLLRVVRAVGERDERARAELPEAERAVRRRPTTSAGTARRSRAGARKPAANAIVGAMQRRDHDLVHDPVPLDAARSRLRDRRADQAADQRVRRARGQAEPPRERGSRRSRRSARRAPSSSSRARCR